MYERAAQKTRKEKRHGALGHGHIERTNEGEKGKKEGVSREGVYPSFSNARMRLKWTGHSERYVNAE